MSIPVALEGSATQFSLFVVFDLCCHCVKLSLDSNYRSNELDVRHNRQYLPVDSIYAQQPQHLVPGNIALISRKA
jgi:hypothetical protein